MSAKIRQFQDFGQKRRGRIGHRIMLARKHRGLSQRELGALLERPVSHATISYIESGIQRVDVAELELFAKILRVPLLDLLGLDYSKRTTWGPPIRVDDDDAIFLDATGYAR